MKCPICREKLIFSKMEGVAKIGNIDYSHEIECVNSPKYRNHIYGLQEAVEPNNILYIVRVEVDNTEYTWQSTHGSKTTIISKLSKDERGIVIKTTLLTRLNEYYAIQNDIKQYEEVIRRVLNLKAFL